MCINMWVVARSFTSIFADIGTYGARISKYFVLLYGGNLCEDLMSVPGHQRSDLSHGVNPHGRPFNIRLFLFRSDKNLHIAVNIS